MSQSSRIYVTSLQRPKIDILLSRIQVITHLKSLLRSFKSFISMDLTEIDKHNASLIKLKVISSTNKQKQKRKYIKVKGDQSMFSSLVKMSAS